MRKSVAVALLNWNGKKWLERFLPVLAEHTPGAVIYLIDNRSRDDSVAWVRKHFPEVKIIPLVKNYGFAGGYNRGLKQIDEDIVVLLNTDVEVTSGWLEPLVDKLRQNNRIVAVQPKIKDWNRKDYFEYAGAAGGFIDFWGYPYCDGRTGMYTEQDRGQYETEKDVHWTSGACMAVDRRMFLQEGGFDENFFAHQEEIDWAWRMRRKGKRLVYVPASTVYHAGGGSLAYGHPQKTFLNFRNNLLMLLKNLPPALLLPVILGRLILDGLAGLMFLLKGKPSHTWAIIRAHFAFYRLIPRYFKERRPPYLRKYYRGFSVWLKSLFKK
ncbi:MAG: glycosyltransferase family 2 protein [Chlorobi bacterium]|nr:glycosyltransferase family 2 protein [Chlorobiota bacterium]